MTRLRRAKKEMRGRNALIVAAIAGVIALASVVGVSNFLADASAAVAGDTTCGYGTTTQFTESTVMRWAQINGSGLTGPTQAQFIAYANDENSTLLGVNTATPFSTAGAHPGDGGDVTQTDGVALAASTIPGAEGTTEQPRPYFPALYITPVSDPGTWTKPGDAIPAATGDWQQGGTPQNISNGTNIGVGVALGKPFVNDVFGTWVTATQNHSAGPAPVLNATLTQALVVNTTYGTAGGTGTFSLPVTALAAAVSSGDVIKLTDGANTQNLTATAPASANATSITVKTFKAGKNFTTNTAVTDTTVQTGDYARGTLPTKNDWTGIPDAPNGTNFAAMGDEGYGTEFRWNASELTYTHSGVAHPLETGHWYKIQIVEHDGDQNKGGDSGEFCTLIRIPGPPPVVTHPVIGQNSNAKISEPLGSTINDSASVTPSQGIPNPHGSMTFHLYFVPNGSSTLPGDACTATPSLETNFGPQIVPLTISGTANTASTAATSPGFTTSSTALGTYVWAAHYEPHVTTTLNMPSGLTAAATQVTVATSAGMGVGDSIKIDNEVMKVTAISGNTLTVTRNAAGSTGGAVPHANGASVTSTDPNYLAGDENPPCGNETVTMVQARIRLSPHSAVNAINTVHTVTVTLDTTTDGTNFFPVDMTGTQLAVNVTLSPSNSTGVFVDGTNTSLGHATTCATGPSGTCTVLLNDTINELLAVHASASGFAAGGPVSNFQGTFGTTATFTPTTGNPCADTNTNSTCDATKQYVIGRIIITPESAFNVVGNPHTIIAKLQYSSDGLAWTSAGIPDTTTTITFTKTFGTATFVNGANTCTTTGGSCSIVITSSTPGQIGIRAASTFGSSAFTGTLSVSTVVGNNCSSDVGAPNAGYGTCDATKTYEDARLLLTPLSATNLTTNLHTITAKVEITSDGSTWTGAGSGISVTFTIDGTVNHLTAPNTHLHFVPDTVAGASCPTDANSVCPVVINDDTAEVVTIHGGTSFRLSGVTGTFTASTGSTGCGAVTEGAFGACNAIKTYISPSTVLHVTDSLAGLPADATGTVTYEAYTNSACSGSTGRVLNDTETITPGATVPVPLSSPAVDVPKNGNTEVWFRATYNGGAVPGPTNYGTFQTDCTKETATSSP